LAGTAADWRVRLRALWALDGIDRIEPPAVATALDDRSAEVRVAAVRIAERWLGQAGHPIAPAVLKRLDDGDWAVRRQLAASLGALPAGAREDALVSILTRYGDDPIVMDAALSGARGVESAILERLTRRADAFPSTRTPVVPAAGGAGVDRRPE
jgi:HEAT repeat protein